MKLLEWDFPMNLPYSYFIHSKMASQRTKLPSLNRQELRTNGIHCIVVPSTVYHTSVAPSSETMQQWWWIMVGQHVSTTIGSFFFFCENIVATAAIAELNNQLKENHLLGHFFLRSSICCIPCVFDMEWYLCNFLWCLFFNSSSPNVQLKLCSEEALCRSLFVFIET